MGDRVRRGRGRGGKGRGRGRAASCARSTRCYLFVFCDKDCRAKTTTAAAAATAVLRRYCCEILVYYVCTFFSQPPCVLPVSQKRQRTASRASALCSRFTRSLNFPRGRHLDALATTAAGSALLQESSRHAVNSPRDESSTSFDRPLLQYR